MNFYRTLGNIIIAGLAVMAVIGILARVFFLDHLRFCR